MVFIASGIGSRSLSSHIKILRGDQSTSPALPDLRHLICLGNIYTDILGVEILSYSTFISDVKFVTTEDSILCRAESSVKPEDVLNLQFTSGKTHVFFHSTII
jgi:hypothetical protein